MKIDSADIQEYYFKIAIIKMIKELKEAMKKCQHDLLYSEFSQNAKAQRVEWKNETIQRVKTKFNKEIGSLKKAKSNKTWNEKNSGIQTKSLEGSSNNRLDEIEEIILNLEDKVKELDHSVKENVKSKKFQEHEKSSGTLWKHQTF